MRQGVNSRQVQALGWLLQAFDRNVRSVTGSLAGHEWRAILQV
ncbi:hypothetical protein SLNWT_5117 [Streptomyces albus]|uniref:Uncharacterized protein n=1 Tax=Streptomyces albus (strain ATCC 21838 / DSM 41398 / FERM P-419 / JCM 4703 / NBRC 107858) TaxID=1081613 RepID=A0A0B5ERP7_STRA4|nr:hypothetical protein SLNWT_5117 [Streptomyces albus]AOU79796.1 hypothetical protein SLNHY_5105 [Streptomyces albus]AYN35519.1 hypothetical protein DUI70_5023 [Streptomyces albus]